MSRSQVRGLASSTFPDLVFIILGNWGIEIKTKTMLALKGIYKSESGFCLQTLILLIVYS